MIGLDTNLLVRYLTHDDPAQARRADAVIARATSQREALHVSCIVLCELVWVLSSGYGIAMQGILSTLERLLQTPQVDLEDRDLVGQALADTRAGRGDFADCLIGRRNQACGCTRTLTFDRDLRRNPAFKVLAGRGARL